MEEVIYISRLTDTNLSLQSVQGWSLDRSIFIQRLFLYYYCARPIIEVHRLIPEKEGRGYFYLFYYVNLLFYFFYEK